MQTAAAGERLAGRQIARQSRGELVLQIATCRSPSETARRPCRFQSITAAKTPVFNKPMSLNGSLRRAWPRQILRNPAWGRRPLLAQPRHPQRRDLGRGHSGHEEAPALERPYYGAEVFHEAARGRTIFASRTEQGMADGGKRRWRTTTRKRMSTTRDAEGKAGISQFQDIQAWIWSIQHGVCT